MSHFLNLKDDFSNFDKLIKVYDAKLNEAELHINPAGKSLHEANSEMPPSYSLYAGLLCELKALEKYVEVQYKRQRGLCWELYKKDSDIDYSSTDLNHIVDADTRVVTKMKFLIITQELVGQYSVVVKALEHLGYKLKNMTDARIAEVHQFVI